MKDKEAILECIKEVLKSINEYLTNDKGALEFIDFADNCILSLSFKGACINCKRNNDYLKTVINEMFEEVIPGVVKEIRYV